MVRYSSASRTMKCIISDTFWTKYLVRRTLSRRSYGRKSSRRRMTQLTSPTCTITFCSTPSARSRVATIKLAGVGVFYRVRQHRTLVTAIQTMIRADRGHRQITPAIRPPTSDRTFSMPLRILTLAWKSGHRAGEFWAFEQAAHALNSAENRVFWGGAARTRPRLKKFLSEVATGLVPTTWWTREFAGDNQEAQRELRLDNR